MKVMLSHVVLIVQITHDERLPPEELSEIYGTWVEHIPERFRIINTQTVKGEDVKTVAHSAISASVILGKEIPMN
jgi:hypothetical protein